MSSFKIVLTAVTMIAAAAAAQAATDSKSKTATGQSPESIECSKQADAKGLHGKERKTFRAECKKELKAKTSKTPAAAPPAAAAPDAGASPPAKKN